VHVGDGISLNATVQVATQVSYDMAYYNMDGTFGLSTDGSGNGQTLMEELAPNLDEPVITIWVNRSSGSSGGVGEITLGGMNPEKCQSDTWVNAGSSINSYYSLPTFNVTSISGPKNGSCANSVEGLFNVSISNSYSTMYTSIQVQDIFVKASGAVYNRGTYGYSVSADKMASAQPVTFTMANGGQLVLTPADYTVKGRDGTIYLNTYGYYDQNTYPTDTLLVGQPFLNNHCVSQNIQTGEWSLANVVV